LIAVTPGLTLIILIAGASIIVSIIVIILIWQFNKENILH
jgi:hypothetical protein